MKIIKKICLIFLTCIFFISNIQVKGFLSVNLSNYSTTDLIEIIINDEIDYINSFSTKFIGINKFKVNNEYYKELEKRENAISILNEMVDESLNINEQDNLILLKDILSDNVNMYASNVVNSRVTNNTGIYTPNGSEVTNGSFKTNSLNSANIQDFKDEVFGDFESFTEDNYIYPANDAYNCHSYAFYNQNPNTNNFWMNYPDIYKEDYSYVVVNNPRPGDILCYTSYGNNDTHGYIQTSIYISHSAIIESVESNFDSSNISTLSKITLISKWGNKGVYKHKGDECYYGTQDSQFTGVFVLRPRINISYNLYNSNNIINETATFSFNASSENKYEMYELTPNYTKNYEFKVSSNSNLDVRLYDVHMQLIPYTDTNSNQYIKQFTKKLKEDEIYYLRVAYTSSSIGGTINTQIISKQIENVDYGNNTMVANEYSYYNSDDSGLFKISIVNNNGNSFSCPNGAIGIYSEFDRFNPLKRLSTSLYELDAVNGVNCNNMIVYLNFGETYYIEVDLPITNYSDYNLKIERIYQIEYIDLLYGNQESYNIIANETGVGDNFKKIEIMDDSSVCIEYDYIGTQSETIYFVLYKEIYNSTTNTYNLQLVFPEMMVTYGESLTWTSGITEGRYYIGYYNKTNSASTISITIG